MGESEYRCWEELLPDALGLVFRNLPLQEVLTVVPRVCKSWGRVVAGPYCWQEIDIEEWSQQRQSRPDQLVRMLDLLVRRSSGACRRISVSGLPCDPLFSFIGDHARALRTLEIPRSEISDAVVEAVAPGLPNLTFLDISSCTKIGARALEAFGRHCRSLEFVDLRGCCGSGTRGSASSARASTTASRTATGMSAPTTTTTRSTRGSSWATTSTTAWSAATTTTRRCGATGRASWRTSRCGSTAAASARATPASTGQRRRDSHTPGRSCSP